MLKVLAIIFFEWFLWFSSWLPGPDQKSRPRTGKTNLDRPRNLDFWSSLDYILWIQPMIISGNHSWGILEILSFHSFDQFFFDFAWPWTRPYLVSQYITHFWRLIIMVFFTYCASDSPGVSFERTRSDGLDTMPSDIYIL